jgi:transcriptional regulator with XRE-family HTH domain
MKTVGQLLKTTREKKGINLHEVEKAIKVRIRHLKALETDQYNQLPSGTYAKGFIKNYAQFLNLPINTALAVFRRDFTENEQGQIIPRSITAPVSSKKLIWTPKTTLISIILIIILVFSGFLYYQYQTFFHPQLEITVPVPGEILLGPAVTVSGFADSSSVVSINGQLVALEPNGSFSTTINLPAGINHLTVDATNPQGHTTIITRTIEVRIE